MAPAYYAPSWAGFYIGGNIGAARHNARFDDFNTGNEGNPGTESAGGCLLNCGSYLSNKTGFIGGGQIGYNWQSGSFVYGLEADASWLDAKAFTDWFPTRDNGNVTSTQSIDWLATVRGRAGLAVDRTLLYITAGVAFAGVKNSIDTTFTCPRCDPADNFSLIYNDTRVGWAVGGGIEHMLTPNWTLRAEALWVDLGQSDRIKLTTPTVVGCGGDCNSGGEHFSARFANDLVIARVGINYKFGDFGGPVVARY